MVSGDRHTSVLFWISAQAEQLVHEGLTDATSLPAITGAVLAMRGQANDLMSSLNRDLPYPYASVVGALINFNIFIQSSKAALELPNTYSSDPKEPDEGLDAGSSLWMLDVFFIFTLNLTYASLSSLHVQFMRVVDVDSSSLIVSEFVVISSLLDKPADPTILSHRTVEPNLTARKLTSLATHAMPIPDKRGLTHRSRRSRGEIAT